MKTSRLATMSVSRLAAYTATAAGGVLVAGSAAQADLMVYENFGTLDAADTFSIDLGVIAAGAKIKNQGLLNNESSLVGMQIGAEGSARFMRFGLVDAGQAIDSFDSFGYGFYSSFFLGSAQGFNGQTGTRYLGFKVHDSNTFSDYYGWIEYVYSSTSPNTVTVSRWAYESNPFGPATAGATGTVADAPAGGAVPGLGGLAALAMGAAGVRRSRNRVA